MTEIGWNHVQLMSTNGISEVREEKWAKHYSSKHQILLVGEGDFSFSLSLAMSFGSASNIVATSLDSYEYLIHKYMRAKTNLEILGRFGAQVIHVVDVINMELHTDLRMRKFDRIVYNFPHAGFIGMESDPSVIMIHRQLVRGFFMNACAMLCSNGEVHVTHKTAHPFHCWKIEELASECGLTLVDRVDFKIKDYPGYNNKRRVGRYSDKPFPVGECNTFKFIASSSEAIMILTALHPQNPQEIPILQRRNRIPVMTRSNCKKHTYSVVDMLKIGFKTYKAEIERCNAENDEKPWGGYIDLLKELKFGFERYNPLDGHVNLLDEEMTKLALEFLYNVDLVRARQGI